MSFPLLLTHDDPSAPSATVLIADAVPGADAHGHYNQLIAYWATHVRLPFYVSDKRSPDPGIPSDTATGSLYVLWSAQLLAQVDVDTITQFKEAAATFRAVPASAAASSEPLYCRYLLIRRSDGGLVSGNSARALLGWQPLPSLPTDLTASDRRDREIAHDDAEFAHMVGVRRETHMFLAARLPDYFVCVRCASQYFALRFGAPVITVGLRWPGSLDTPGPAPAPSPNAPQQPQPTQSYPFIASAGDGCTLITVLAASGAGQPHGYFVLEETPAPAEARLADAGFFTIEGTNAASIALPYAEVVPLLISWGWTQVSESELVG